MFLYKLTFPTYNYLESQTTNLGKIFIYSPSVLIVNISPCFINSLLFCSVTEIFFFFFFRNSRSYLFIDWSIAVLGLRFCARAFSSCGKWGPLFIALRGPLTIAASLAAEHRLQMRRLSNCGSRAQLLRGMRDLPRPGLKPVSPALAGRLPTTAPPGKPQRFLKYSFLGKEFQENTIHRVHS